MSGQTTADALGHASFSPAAANLPPLKSYVAKDGARLGFRFYDSVNKDKAIILLHGSSSHGEYLHELAQYLSLQGVGQVYVPNLRGHYGSGGKRGDCAYVGQLEDDLYDFINLFDLQNKKVYIAGHSSGGGLAIRYSGGPYGDEIAGYILISPAIPRAPTMRQGTAGGWATVSLLKMVALSFLNTIGITYFNHLHVIRFNKPQAYCDGRETLSYSYNLYSSYHPRQPYDRDIESLRGRFLLITGSRDEANDHRRFAEVMRNPSAVKVIEGARHLDIVQNPSMMEMAANWIKN